MATTKISRFSCFKLWFIVMILIPNYAVSKTYQFGSEGCENCGWFVVVDGVMGGLSSGKIESNAEGMRLSGSVSLANNGGFSSVRTRYERIDLSTSTEVLIRYRSVGQSFAITLNNYRRFWRPQFKAFLPETNGEWVERIIPFVDFKKMRFDSILGDGPSEKELANIIRLGLISNDKKEGPFEFEISELTFR